jgi:hypothetical protein
MMKLNCCTHYGNLCYTNSVTLVVTLHLPGFYVLWLIVLISIVKLKTYFLWLNVINPLPLLFKSLLPGQEDCIFFSGHLNTRTCHYILLR